MPIRSQLTTLHATRHAGPLPTSLAHGREIARVEGAYASRALALAGPGAAVPAASGARASSDASQGLYRGHSIAAKRDA